MKGSIILLSGWLLFAVLLAGSLTRSHTSRRRWFRLLSYPRIPTSRHLPRSPQHEPNFFSNLLRPPCRFYFRMAAFYRWTNALPICARANDPSMDRHQIDRVHASDVFALCRFLLDRSKSVCSARGQTLTTTILRPRHNRPPHQRTAVCGNDGGKSRLKFAQPLEVKLQQRQNSDCHLQRATQLQFEQPQRFAKRPRACPQLQACHLASESQQTHNCREFVLLLARRK